ncbi:uncharacterized protein LOC111235808 isoform X1 [Seriola dumerili]|uniref:uncharacterized protein LOC111235808 isoform X1 n=1 Tax=Seriola dumerili TaxID=41447 RepID=UPI000BBEF9B2|nr:uncharacterized protein LOC111235808 isoform X1 [Seriola dumerili]
MMQKVLIFLLIIWNSSTFSSENTGRYNLQFLLGCQAVIPCQQKSESNSFRWFYKKNEHSHEIRIFSQDKTGLALHHASRPRGSITNNAAFMINHFGEEDQGLYWCENCYQGKCEKSAVIRVKKAILDEIHETFYVTAGNSFTHACPGEFTDLKWTFEASDATAPRISAVRSKIDFVTSNKSIHIVNVEKANAGKYTCWISGCDGHRQKLLTINLCVVTVHQIENSSVSCALICDLEFSHNKSNNISNKETGTRMISVRVELYGSLNCSAKRIFDLQITRSNSTHTPSNALNKTTDIHTKLEYLTPVIYGTSAALVCLILMALLIFYLRSRSRADISDRASGCGIEGRGEETSVVYSSFVIRRPAKTTNYHVTSSDCVYSEIHVKRKEVPN